MNTTTAILPHYDLSPFASKDRPAIMAVHFGRGRVEATDGAVLAYVERAGGDCLPDVALDAADYHKATVAGAVSLTPTATGIAATTRRGDVLGVRVSDANYPETHRLVAENGTDYREFTVGASSLRALADYAMKHTKRNQFGKVPVTLRVPREAGAGGDVSNVHFRSELSAGGLVRGVIAECRP